MNSRLRYFDWQLFWVVEVVLLAIPTLLAVVAYTEEGALPPRAASVLLIVLIGLTIVNLFWHRQRAARVTQSNRR